MLIVASLEPHLRQNFDPGGLLRPQDGHSAPIFAPHSLQKAASGRLSLLQLGHSIDLLPRQFVEQRLGVFQIGGVEALGEPVVDFGEHRARFVADVLSFEGSCEIGRRAPHHATPTSRIF